MSTQNCTPQRMYGHRARIGYVCPPPIGEVVPYEFYKIVPDGVTLVITTLTVTEPSKSQVEQAYELSMRAARALAEAGVDLVFLGGVPVNLARGTDNAEAVLARLEAELGVKVSSSVAAQERAAKVLGARKVVIGHGYGPQEDARLTADAQHYGCEVLGTAGLGYGLGRFGSIPASAALDLGRTLMHKHP